MKMTTKATLAAMVFFMATAVPAMAANGMSNDVPGASSIILAGNSHGMAMAAMVARAATALVIGNGMAPANLL